jgi:hypothetical protein
MWYLPKGRQTLDQLLVAHISDRRSVSKSGLMRLLARDHSSRFTRWLISPASNSFRSLPALALRDINEHKLQRSEGPRGTLALAETHRISSLTQDASVSYGPLTGRVRRKAACAISVSRVNEGQGSSA